jgi:hypothetical protein
MAKMVGVWMYVVPRRPKESPVHLKGGGTIILTEEDKRKLGDNSMRVKIRVMDDDPGFDDEVFKDSFRTLSHLNIGPNTFDISTFVPLDKVAVSEPSSESWAELYFRVQASDVGSGVKTKWANSQNENVPYE